MTTITKRHAVEVDTLRMALHVRYEDEDMPSDYPFREGDMWTVDVDLATGKIKNWPGGHALDLYMKVCDEGVYTLLAAGKEVATRDGYVPDAVPGDYGDYVDLKIADDGTIKNWPSAIDLGAFGDE